MDTWRPLDNPMVAPSGRDELKIHGLAVERGSVTLGDVTKRCGFTPRYARKVISRLEFFGALVHRDE